MPACFGSAYPSIICSGDLHLSDGFPKVAELGLVVTQLHTRREGGTAYGEHLQTPHIPQLQQQSLWLFTTHQPFADPEAKISPQ